MMTPQTTVFNSEETRRLRCRPVSSEDISFLYEVYAGTRQEELEKTGWTFSEKEVFLRGQFDAQHRYYSEHYPDAAYEIIVLEDQAIGRFYVDHRKDEMRLMDIALLPQYRNQGIGSRLLHALLEKAQAQNKPVRIHVEQFNPAMRLYKRLGFRHLEDRGVYQFMAWTPDSASSISGLKGS